jgi:hypothetical protein
VGELIVEKVPAFSSLVLVGRPGGEGSVPLDPARLPENAEYLLRVEVSRISQRIDLTLQLIAVESGEIARQENCGGSGWRELENSLGPALERLSSKAALGEARGELHAVSEPAGARVFVDEQYAGTTPLLISLGARRHELMVVKEGYKTYLGFTPIESGSRRRLQLKLEPRESRANIDYSSEDYFFVPGLRYGGTTQFYLMSYPVYDALQIMNLDRYLLASPGIGLSFYRKHFMISGAVGTTLLSSPPGSGELNWFSGDSAWFANLSLAPMSAFAVRLADRSLIAAFEIGANYQNDSFFHDETGENRRLQILSAEVGGRFDIAKESSGKRGWFVSLGLYASFPLLQSYRGPDGSIDYTQIAYANGAWDGQEYYWPGFRIQLSAGRAADLGGES